MSTLPQKTKNEIKALKCKVTRLTRKNRELELQLSSRRMDANFYADFMDTFRRFLENSGYLDL